MGDAQRHTWGGKYSLRKAVNQVNRLTKRAKIGHNTGFLRLARPSQRRPRTWRWERKRGAALLSFSVCLFRAGILVNSRSDWGCARLRSSAMPFAVGAYITFSSACPLAG